MGALVDRSALVPTEDTIEALLDHLVFPLLPIRDSPGEVLSDHQQIMVAKQMHAVVILYNYYHRKQFPELEVLGFESCCKLCCIAKPGLFMYLRYMHGCEESSENLYSQLSVTEKMVMDACNICIGLDSSKDVPIIEGWQISKVAVFLVDSTEENCVLQFCSITQGVWSLVEKALEPCHKNCLLQNELYESEEALEQLAFSAVEQETGISHSDLSILERHLTYSLSHEKAAARLYIMKCGRALSKELTVVAIKDVIRSLEGPLVKKDQTCEITPVVEYYHLLPYIEIISRWLSREDTHRDSLDIQGQQIVNEGKCTLDSDGIPSMEDFEVKIKFVSNESKGHIQNSKASRTEFLETNRNDLSSTTGSSGAASRPENRADGPCIEPYGRSIIQGQSMNDKSMQDGQDKDELNSKKNKLKDAITYNRRVGGSLRVANSCKVVDSKHPLVPNRMPTVENHGIGKRSVSNEESLNIKNNEMVKTEGETTKKNINNLPTNNGSSCAISRSQNIAGVSQMETDSLVTMKDQATKAKDNECSKKNIKDAVTSYEKSDDSCTQGAITNKGGMLPPNLYQLPSHGEDISGTNIISDVCTDKGKDFIYSSLPVSVDGSEDQAGLVDSVKCIAKCTVEDSTSGSSSDQDLSALGSLPLVPMQFSSNDPSAFYHVMASKKNDLLQASLRVFQKKRDDLYQQKRLLEDEIASCEMNIQTILREGKESPILKVELIIEALNSLCSSQVQFCTNLSSEEQSPSQNIKRRKLSEAVLSSANSCQELDDICHKNSWMLPKYSVLPSFSDCQITGMFKAMVTVCGTDFECNSHGDLKSSPREARESAAMHMLRTLRTCKQQ